MNLFNFLIKKLKISIDTADLNYIKKFNFCSLTSNPTLIFNSLISNCYNDVLYNLLKNKNKFLLDSDSEISFYDKLLIIVVGNLLPYVKNKISIEIPARVSYSYNKIIIYTFKLFNLINKMGIDLNKILVKIPATNSGIKAAEHLKKYNINSNLTLIFDTDQVKKCFDSNIYLISPFVGRISDIIKCKFDAGVNFVKNIISFKNSNNYKTLIMGASFRNINQILNLINCDYLTISPKYFNKLLNYNIDNNFNDLINNNFFIKKTYSNKISNKLLYEGINQFVDDHNQLINVISFILKNFKF